MARTIQQLFDLKGQTALVTGGSRGLGLQMAHALGEAGAKVIVSSRKAEDLVQAVAELKAAGIDADWIAADCGKTCTPRRFHDRHAYCSFISYELSFTYVWHRSFVRSSTVVLVT